MAIENIANISFPANHLLNIQLVRIDNENDKYQNKPQFHIMFGFHPGYENDNGGRGYDFKNNAISMKLSLNDALAYAFTLKESASGNHSQVTPYTIFTKSQNTTKTINVYYGKEEKKIKKNGEEKSISLPKVNTHVAITGNRGNSVSMPAQNAYAFGVQIEKLVQKGLELEMERQMGKVSFNQGGQARGNSSNNNSKGDAPFDFDDEEKSGDSPFELDDNESESQKKETLSDFGNMFED